MSEPVLTSAWLPRNRRLDHPERRRLRLSPARIKWLMGGRRSGKSLEGLDAILIGHGPIDAAGNPKFRGALNPPAHVHDPTYVIAAPTREMVKRLWWRKLKARLPRWMLARDPQETELSIDLANGARLECLGMDRPTRAEGTPIDGLVGDEFAYWKQEAFERSLRPSMSTRGRLPGWAMLVGKPQGRNHFYDAWERARNGEAPGQDGFFWHSSVVVAQAELDEARASMSKRAFAQEYEACALTQTGLVYDSFDRARHVRDLTYDPNLPLVFSFDFNVEPGAAVAIQEQSLPPASDPSGKPEKTTCVLFEVFEPEDSRTPLVCQKLSARFPEHKGPVRVHGDVGGHQRRTSASTTDWEIVRQILGKLFPSVTICVGRSAPSMIDSVNAVNSRLLSATDVVRLAVDPRCAETIRDFEGVVWDDRYTDRDIDKRDKRRTHWTDSIRYYIAEVHPIGRVSAFY